MADCKNASTAVEKTEILGIDVYFEEFYDADECLEGVLSSSRRLFNRRGSSDSQGSSDEPIKPKQLNVNAPEFIPQLWRQWRINATFTSDSDDKNDVAATVHRKKKGSPPKKQHRKCQYCIRQGLDSAMYGSHTMRYPHNGTIMCPILAENM